MKMNNLKRKMIGVFAGGMAVASLATTNVMAASEGDNINDSQVTVTKEITKQAKAYAPATTFNFTLTPATAVSTIDGVAIAKVAEDAKESNIYVGPAGGATLESNTITSTPKETDINQTTVTAGTTTVKLNNASFTAPGIYRYVLTETEGNYEGITYNTTPMYFDVYVDNTNTPYSYSFVSSTDSKVKSDGKIVNDYDKDETDSDAGKGVYNVSAKKTVTGNQGDKTKAFEFKISVNGADNENYYYEIIGSDTAVVSTGKLVSKAAATTVSLKDGQTVKIYGLTASDTYTIEETSYTTDGYKTTIDSATTNTATGTLTADKDISVTNEKNINTPTGIIMQFGPYILIAGLAVGILVVSLRRRRAEED